MFRSVTHLNGWQEGETLYSLCARHHHIAGNSISAVTSRQLFGSAQAAAHDFPHHLDQLVTRLGPTFGTVEEIASRRTILPFYLNGRSEQARRDALAAVTFGGCGSLKGSLGLLASRFGASHPLKACLHCRHEAVRSIEADIWRIEHQWPGVWTCWRCGSALHWTTERVHGGNRFAWLLPADCQFRQGVSAQVSETDLEIIRSFTATILAYVQRGFGTGIDPDRFRRTYRQRLFAMNMMTSSGRIDVAAFASHVVKSTQALARISVLAALPTSGRDVEIQFMRLVRNTFRPAHMLRHLTLIHALFGDWDGWLAAYRDGSDTPRGDRQEAPDPDPEVFAGDPRRQQFSLLVSHGNSVSRAAHMTGIAVATGIAWAAQSGVRVRRRPSQLTPTRRAAAVEALQSGATKAGAAMAAEVSLSTINMLLKSEPGLRRAWHAVSFVQAQNENRQAWESTANALMTPHRKQMRNLQPAVFAWLYRNDRAWLEAFNAHLAFAVRPVRSRIDWDRRDRDFAHAIEVARAALSIEHPRRAIRIADLCDRVPGLKARLSQLHHLPLTRKALVQRRRQAGA